MSDSDFDNSLYRGEVLIHLRHGIRRSSRLAEQLAHDAIVGTEALALLGRLNAIGAELDSLCFAGSDPRQAFNDLFWNKPPHPFRQSPPAAAGM